MHFYWPVEEKLSVVTQATKGTREFHTGEHRAIVSAAQAWIVSCRFESFWMEGKRQAFYPGKECPQFHLV